MLPPASRESTVKFSSLRSPTKVMAARRTASRLGTSPRSSRPCNCDDQPERSKKQTRWQRDLLAMLAVHPAPQLLGPHRQWRALGVDSGAQLHQLGRAHDLVSDLPAAEQVARSLQRHRDLVLRTHALIVLPGANSLAVDRRHLYERSPRQNGTMSMFTIAQSQLRQQRQSREGKDQRPAAAGTESGNSVQCVEHLTPF